jgi:TonB family protein
VNEAIDRLIVERQRLDQGLPATVLASIAAHLVAAGLTVGLPMLLPREPALRVVDGFAVVLPRGGGGSPVAAPPAAAPAPQPAPAATAPPAAPPQVLKPPKAEPRPQALPLPDSRRSAKRPAEPPPLPLPGSRTTTTAKAAAASGGVPGARGAGSAIPGLELGGPPGPGVPDGTDSGGDWYLAGVQQKIWMLWTQQIRSGFTQPVGVTFTILPDGNVTGLRVTQPSGASLLDMAAQRAILNAAPFGPLPREYGQNPRTIQALFKPIQ